MLCCCELPHPMGYLFTWPFKTFFASDFQEEIISVHEAKCIKAGNYKSMCS